MHKLVVCLLVCAATAPAQQAKNYKDAAEYNLYESVVKDIDAGGFAKAVADLDAWKTRYGESDFKQEREFFYVLAYAGTNQPDKVIDLSTDLLANGSLDAAKQVRVLYSAATAIQQIPNPTEQQLATASKAARDLAAFDKTPDGIAPDAWASTLIQLQTTAHGALLYVALLPGAQALRKNDCAGAESALRKALDEFPESAQAAGYLGETWMCLYKTDRQRAPFAIYEFARAASLDPAKGMADPKWQQQTVEPALERLYTSYHGADPEGLRQLKELAVKSPLPPEGFSIDSAAQIAQRKQADFEAKNPELALWLRIKAALTAADGDQYFASDLDGVDMPQLKGILIEAKPACRPTELRVAVPSLDTKPPFLPEIDLKLEKPLAGRPDLNGEIRWEGTGAAFTKAPFLLTVKTAKEKIQGLNFRPCTTSPITRK
ncbi:MAG: hypothetical protein JO307_00120 [Bryobacterales bacterium]|nr:hypothetical protein [Bryobacterales bacterium]MBV9401366.1 hypothetical protein [Bryobacterales bacterium]